MTAYAAFLRGVMPTNLKMTALKACVEDAGFSYVKTILASGNVVFTGRNANAAAVEKKLETTMSAKLGRVFMTFVRPIDTLQEMLDADPYARLGVPVALKRVVTFLREPQRIKVPVTQEGATILHIAGTTVFTAYERRPNDPAFMRLIDKTFGRDVTTRTWDTVKKVVTASQGKAPRK